MCICRAITAKINTVRATEKRERERNIIILIKFREALRSAGTIELHVVSTHLNKGQSLAHIAPLRVTAYPTYHTLYTPYSRRRLCEVARLQEAGKASAETNGGSSEEEIFSMHGKRPLLIKDRRNPQ